MVLFIIKNSVGNETPDIIKYGRKGDKVVLIQEAVSILQTDKSNFIQFLKNNKIELFALKEDLELRGIKSEFKANIVDYNGFLELIEENEVFS